MGRVGLALTIVPAFAFLFDAMSLDTVKTTMIVGTVLWLGISPFIQRRNSQDSEN